MYALFVRRISLQITSIMFLKAAMRKLRALSKISYGLKKTLNQANRKCWIYEKKLKEQRKESAREKFQLLKFKPSLKRRSNCIAMRKKLCSLKMKSKKAR